jgi:hypothetical protein
VDVEIKWEDIRVPDDDDDDDVDEDEARGVFRTSTPPT